MTRGTKKRTWVKLDCQGVLHGSINWLFNLEEQAVFLKLIPMAAVYCKTPGTIADNEGKPLSREFIAYELHCPVETLNSVIDKGTKDNCLKDTEEGLVLVNFSRYQFTEYDRQKPWRERQREKKKKEQIDPNKYTQGKYGRMVHTGDPNDDLEGTKEVSDVHC
jgi:hypothetical protein